MREKKNFISCFSINCETVQKDFPFWVGAMYGPSGYLCYPSVVPTNARSSAAFSVNFWDSFFAPRAKVDHRNQIWSGLYFVRLDPRVELLLLSLFCPIWIATLDLWISINSCAVSRNSFCWYSHFEVLAKILETFFKVVEGLVFLGSLGWSSIQLSFWSIKSFPSPC